MGGRWRPIIAVMLGLVWAQASLADLAVIVNPDSGVERLERSEAVNIFMGRYKRLPSGLQALPVDLTPSKAAFYRALVDQELSQVNSYWARLVFSGRGSPPRQIGSAEAVLELVRGNRGAIGYVDEEDLGPGVRKVLVLSP